MCAAPGLVSLLCVWLMVVLLVWPAGASRDPAWGSPLASQQRQLYVSTIDGGLTALDEEGHTLWTYSARNPLFFSSLSHGESGKAVSEHIIPSLDRGIYRWDGVKLSQLPFSADDIIDHTHILDGRHSVLAGARANDVVGINIHTGKPIYECTHEKCHRYDNQSLIQRMDVLKLSISRVTVREANDLTGEEMWNFTVGNMELMLIEGEEKEEEETGGHSCNLFEELDWEVHVDTLLGRLYSTPKSDSEHQLWEVQLGVPVVRAWFLEGGKLGALSLSHDSTPVHPSLMMVHYGSQYYLQPVEGFQVRELGGKGGGHGGLAIATTGNQVEEYRQVHMRQFSLVNRIKFPSASGDKVIGQTSLVSYNSDTFQELCTAGPNGLAVYFYVDPLPHETCKTGQDNKSGDSSAAVCSVPPDSTPQSYQRSSWQYWLARKLYSVVKYMLFGAFVLACNKLRRYVAAHRQRLSSGSSSSGDVVNDGEFPLLDQLVNTLRRHSSLDSVSTTPIAQMPSTPSSSTETLTPSLSRSNSLSEPRVLPRFGSDYELRGRLGKGGFGVVYHVQNKTDGGEYAVKRIKLPGKKAAREKVMREVRALAQLDHVRIVRYFNSWVEKAPVGWNEMEEWMPLSRRSSFIQDCVSSTHVPGTKPPSISLIPAPLARLGGHSLSPCPSFTSLNHSTIHSVLPPISSDSRSSSFVIEFEDDSLSSESRLDQTLSNTAMSDLLSSTTAVSGGCDSSSGSDSSRDQDGSATPGSQDGVMTTTGGQNGAMATPGDQNGAMATPGGQDGIITTSGGQDGVMTTTGGQNGAMANSGGQDGAMKSSNGYDGCFSRALLRDRDELSSASSESQSTEDKDEQRDRIAPFVPSPHADRIADLAAEPPTYLFIQMQLCKKESLKDWLKSNITNRCPGKVMHFFDQILDAVMYVHSKGMMHRDLKPSNIFFSLEGNIKVGDFGLVTSSAYGGLQNSYLALKGLGEDQQYRQQHTGNLGSHFYMSPELISGRKYNHKVDIFSLGVIFFELHYPFDTDMERAKVLEDVRQYKLPSNFETMLPVQAELVKWLTAHHPNDRPIVKDIYDSATFKQLKANVMETIPKL